MELEALATSTRQLAWGVVKRLYWILPSFLTDPFDIAERWLKVTWEPPQFLFWLLLGIGLSVAVVLTYYDLQRQYSLAVKTIEKEDWETRRSWLRKQRQPDLANIRDLLVQMGQRLRELVQAEIAKNTPIDEMHLDTIHQYLYKEKGLSRKNATFQQHIEYLYELSLAMDALNVGLTRLKDADSIWQKLSEKLTTYSSRITDEELNERIKRYLLVIQGANSYVLSKFYAEKCGWTEDLRRKVKALGARDYMDVMQREAFVAVARRIEQLLAGDEAK
jgi:hypothetical protein